jgi:MOSC domain-containing protein YiiM
MIRVHSLLIGQPQMITDERGTWQSAIFRTPISEPVELQMRGLAGDQVADTANHGSPDQAVCCHPLAHYTFWNEVYGLSTPGTMLGPGSVGENWTLSDVTEHDVCVGDIYKVGDGTARVQVSGPRYPCTKQERKLKLPEFHRRILETMRTGFYVRVLTPGMVQIGVGWVLEQRPQPELTVHAVNVCAHQAFDRDFAQRLLETPELGSGWKRIFKAWLGGETKW